MGPPLPISEIRRLPYDYGNKVAYIYIILFIPFFSNLLINLNYNIIILLASDGFTKNRLAA